MSGWKARLGTSSAGRVLRGAALVVALGGGACDAPGEGGGTWRTTDVGLPDGKGGADLGSGELGGGADVPTSHDATMDPGPIGSDAEAVCGRWNAVHADDGEGAWSGSVSACLPGDVSADGRDAALARVNLYRELAGLPPVSDDPARNAGAQACALMMDANGAITHTPPKSWACYTGAGAEAAGLSNVATTAGVAAVGLYMIDPGNASTLGHRRWILSRRLGPIGLGTTDEFSCMWVLGGSGQAAATWTAWPPPGAFPIEANSLGWTSLDETGWSLQSDSVDLAAAKVTVTSGGVPRPVTVTALQPNFGSKHAIAFRPVGWTAEAGETYDVTVTGTAVPIAYRVEMVDCGAR